MYKESLVEKGYRIDTALGFHKRAGEIVRIVKEQQADLLVIGAHGHKGLEDFIHGQHNQFCKARIEDPVLVVNV